jgi:IclR family acetate operon transcriptional repressor
MTVQISRKRGRPRSFNDTSESTVIQSLDRAMLLLKVVAGGKGMSLTEIADASGQSASTAYRVLITLQKHGIVEFDEVNQLWHVGVEAFRIGSVFLGRTSLIEQSRSVMQAVVAETGETANLAIMDGAEVVFLSQVETHEPIRAFFRPGTRGPVHTSGIGKALLAFFPQRRIDEVLKQTELKKFTDKTITEETELVAELARIRDLGWSVDDEERNTGMRCIAAPIFNSFGEAVAGLSISGPSVRVAPDQDVRLGPLIKAAAHEVTKAIGGRLP